MNATAPAMCFLVEWYRTGPVALTAEDAAAQLSRAAGADRRVPPTTLMMAMNVPEDQTFFGVFSATNVDAVVQACRRAGWPADRISTNVHVWPRGQTQRAVSHHA